MARARRRWMRDQGMFDPARLVFIDETSTNTAMVRLRGRAPRGERLVDYAPHGAWKTVTFVGGLRQRGMTAPFVIEGAMNGPMFNPIELAFSKLKAHLRKAAEHTIPRLLRRIGRVVTDFSPQECRNFFRHAGYVRT